MNEMNPQIKRKSPLHFTKPGEPCVVYQCCLPGLLFKVYTTSFSDFPALGSCQTLYIVLPLSIVLCWWAVWWTTISCNLKRTKLLVSPWFQGRPFLSILLYMLGENNVFWYTLDMDSIWTNGSWQLVTSFITSFFSHPSSLFSVTHQMALSLYL